MHEPDIRLIIADRATGKTGQSGNVLGVADARRRYRDPRRRVRNARAIGNVM